MLRLMIVDDEKTTRESLERYIPWGSLNIGAVFTARNGIEALALARQEPPDILLTDVRMPKMDGIALAREVRDAFPCCRVIFLSGYADKEYLKSAIRLQAVAYVEKPVDVEELKEAVRSAAAAIAREAEEQDEAERLRRSCRDSASVRRGELVRALAKGGDIRDIRAAYPDALPGLEPSTWLTVAAVALRWNGQPAEGERAGARKRLLAACGARPPFNQTACLIGFVETDTLAVIVSRRITAPPPGGRSPFSDLLSGLPPLAGAYAATVGVGEPGLGWESVPRSYASALQSASRAFYGEGDPVVFPREGRAERFEVDSDAIGRFRDSLRDGDVEDAEDQVGQIADQARLVEALDVDSVRDVFFRLYLAVFETARASGASPSVDEKKTYVWQEIRELSSLSDLARFILRRIAAAFGAPAREAALPRKILEIQRYARANYACASFGLQSIADHSGLNRTYLCSLFKAYTGKSINEYVTDLRIQKARELLRESRLRAHEIALRVGYQDANYFSAIFKRLTGSTPTEYREAE